LGKSIPLIFQSSGWLTRGYKETFSVGTLLVRECHLSVHPVRFSECLLSVSQSALKPFAYPLIVTNRWNGSICLLIGDSSIGLAEG
jgi:hypothetical protein